MGDVQSGKTASYAALICKAADAGYRMVVLLTGTLENVRRQTQERLDAAFVGLDSRDFLTVGQIGRKTHVGVGLLDGRRDGIVFTSRDSDFRKNTASALNISLIADDDEAFTYNKRVNRLATVQEHYMIVRALERGVSEEKLAKALDVDIKHIKRRLTLLNGICPEVIDILKDKVVNPQTFEILQKMKAVRQIEVAELMTTAGNYTSTYAKALLAATRQHDLVHPDKPKKISGLTPEQMARMEREMDTLQRDFKSVEASYGDDVLHLVIATAYLSKLVANPEIERFLAAHHPEILDEFRSIISAASLDQATATA